MGAPPAATRRDDVRDTLHGVVVADPYRWLEDVTSPEVQAWMEEQDAHARAELDRLPGRAALRRRLEELHYVDTMSAPQHHAGRYFFGRRAATEEKRVIYWRQGKSGPDRVLLDPNGWSTDGSVALGDWAISPDGRKVAYTRKENNSDEATLHVQDVESGALSSVDVIPGAKYAWPSWGSGSNGFWYTWVPVDPSIPVADRPGHAEVRYHRLGEPPEHDARVHGATGDPTTFIRAHESRDGRWLVLTVRHGWRSCDVKVRDLRHPEGGFRVLVAGRDALFHVTTWHDRFYVQTNEGAPRGRVLRVDPERLARDAWEEIVPEHPVAVLEDATLVGGRLVLSYLRDARSLLAVHELDGTFVREVPLPALGSAFGPSGHEDEDEAYFGFTTFTRPPEIHAMSMATGATSLWYRREAPLDPDAYEVRQVRYPSKDGTPVTMFLVARKDLPRDGDAPTILMGYGGFQVSYTPAFVPSLFPWLDRGGLFALANLRGGGEYGEDWHRDGMLERKQNTFDDFIAAAEILVRERHTRPARLAIYGGSNGGLLVGAVMVQRPELFRAVVCAVPLLDMLRYHLFGSGKTWVGEYGDPEDPALFHVLRAYSPYHQLKPGTAYPPLLLLSADSDDRVDPMHARKFTAALRHATTGGPVLLRIERNAGHGGADLIRATVDREVDRLAFLLAELDVAAPAGA